MLTVIVCQTNTEAEGLHKCLTVSGYASRLVTARTEEDLPRVETFKAGLLYLDKLGVLNG